MLSPFTPDQGEQTLNSVKGYYSRLPRELLKSIPKSERKVSSTNRPNPHLLHNLAPPSTWLYASSQHDYGLKPPTPEDDNKIKSVSGKEKSLQ